SESLAKLAIVSGSEFPKALNLLRDWFNTSINDLIYVVYLLCERKLCEEFPAEVLEFLGTVVDSNSELIPSYLEQCLDEIVLGNPNLSQEPQFIELKRLLSK